MIDNLGKTMSIKVKILSKVLYYIIRLLNLTYRFEFHNVQRRELARESHPQKLFIYAIWHQNIIAALLSHLVRKEFFTMIISESKDGEFIARTCAHIGHQPARGSSTRGGKRAMVEMIQFMKQGYNGVLTVDGPTGPARQSKWGVIDIAKLIECPIVPMVAYPDKYWSLEKTWDKFRIPKPFSRIVVVMGDGIEINKDIPREDYPALSAEIDRKINLVEEEARAILKH